MPPPAPIWEQSLIIEAKRDLITQLPTAQWQICAILATQSQLLPLPAPPFPRYLRGILTDGRYWAFYQLSTALPTFQSTVLIDATAPGMPAGVALVGGGAVPGSEIVLRMLRKYVLLWNQTNVDGWL
ncbi:hypothetical protein VZ95_13055 [Elstera litoralis]|uniref:Uncharacterized protein n=1 Tax=Elstera litoralis TaxID=552518 RepID=A0A0F3IRM3_9PROT|nr:hypothetical protein [Elstera litoralis]KJV09193.1 hypothetical protein VZ95_13055 [Elstera litoralis]